MRARWRASRRRRGRLDALRTTPTYIQTTLLSKPQFGYDSLMPVVTVFYDPEVLYVRAQSPHRTLADAIALAKQSQGKARWGAAYPASLERIAMERLTA